MGKPDEIRTTAWADIFGEETPYPEQSESSPSPASPAPPTEEKQEEEEPVPARRPIRGSKHQAEFEFTGRPVYNVRWDDLGIGMMQQMGYMPNRPIHVEVRKGKWFITGARTSSPMLLFLALGAGGLVYILQDLLRNMSNMGEIIGALVVLIPPLLNLVVRVRTLELFPYELDLVGYDRIGQILVLSTVTDPGGVVAMRVDLPTDEAQKKAEEAKLIENLRRSHTGFMLFDSRASETEESAFKGWALRAFIWVVIIGIAAWFYFTHKLQFH